MLHGIKVWVFSPLRTKLWDNFRLLLFQCGMLTLTKCTWVEMEHSNVSCLWTPAPRLETFAAPRLPVRTTSLSRGVLPRVLVGPPLIINRIRLTGVAEFPTQQQYLNVYKFGYFHVNATPFLAILFSDNVPLDDKLKSASKPPEVLICAQMLFNHSWWIFREENPYKPFYTV